MTQGHVLEYIWSGDIVLRTTDNRSPLAMLLDSVLSVPTVSLVVNAEMIGPKAYPDSEELFPGCQLGDVLFEELGIEVPCNSVVLLEPAAAADAEWVSTSELGRQLGELLSAFVGQSKPERAPGLPKLIVSRGNEVKEGVGQMCDARATPRGGAQV